MSLFVLIGSFVVLLVIGFPVAYAMIAATVIVLLVSEQIPMAVVASQLLNGINEWTLLAIPVFLFAGNLMNAGGLTFRLVDAFQGVMGRLRGGLGHAAVGVNAVMAGMSGSDLADATATGSAMIPSMTRAGYPPAFSATLIGAAATMGAIIPPSIAFILYGLVANVSVNRLFAAGAIPGLVIACALFIYNAIAANIMRLQKQEKVAPREVLRRLVVALPAALLPFIVIGGILGGFFTPTEAASVAALVAITVGMFVFGDLTIARTWDALYRAGRDSASILLVVAASSLLGLILTITGGSEQIANGLVTLAPNKWMLLLIVNVALLVLTAFFESTPVLVLIVPLLVPTLVKYGVDPVHFGVVAVFNLMVGLILPPGGLAMYILCRIAGVSIGEFMRTSIPVLFTLFVVLAVLTYVPELSLTLPNFLQIR